jgi:hypothetical protein
LLFWFCCGYIAEIIENKGERKMKDISVNMNVTDYERSVERMILTKITPEDAVLKLIEIQGEGRYFPLRSYWHEALTLGVLGLKRS